MSLVKIPFIITAALATHIATTAPNPPPPAAEIPKEVSAGERLFSKLVQIMPSLAKVVAWISCFCEVSVILAGKFPANPLAVKILQELGWGSAQFASRIEINTPFAIGWVLTVVGGFVRWQCYRALGRLFTYQIAVRKGHRLVTDGPYSVVRHPSYTAGIVGFCGMAVCLACPGSWVRESGVLTTAWGRTIMYGWGTWTAYLVSMLCLRTPEEDRMLRKQFGEEWDTWAAKVPYRLLPGVF
ncbi:hypothetical protein OBBRIDRAFT_831441 [Obba rivulosa]|uniref:Protein-S-isoprenylcysteine O-methyltransferase n=1 Tax=Obba rivulosa TaxID=1052685 RepID=A0A8E2J578_9APHY|nr:hypothetical protein OBBRIDRAFT_831441 [Obba rivulosa]